jgi:hypothetical protein
LASILIISLIRSLLSRIYLFFVSSNIPIHPSTPALLARASPPRRTLVRPWIEKRMSDTTLSSVLSMATPTVTGLPEHALKCSTSLHAGDDVGVDYDLILFPHRIGAGKKHRRTQVLRQSRSIIQHIKRGTRASHRRSVALLRRVSNGFPSRMRRVGEGSHGPHVMESGCFQQPPPSVPQNMATPQLQR